jgi:hypothetical protein
MSVAYGALSIRSARWGGAGSRRPDREMNGRRFERGATCSSIRALRVESQMSVQPRGRIARESRVRRASAPRPGALWTVRAFDSRTWRRKPDVRTAQRPDAARESRMRRTVGAMPRRAIRARALGVEARCPYSPSAGQLESRDATRRRTVASALVRFAHLAAKARCPDRPAAGYSSRVADAARSL